MKKKKATPTHDAVRTSPRSARGLAAHRSETGPKRGFPSLAELARDPSAMLGVRAALSAAAASLVAVGASGCAPPSCQPTRVEEVAQHAKYAVSGIADLRMLAAGHELLMGFGLEPHPMIAGAMMPVTPTPVPSPVASTPPPVEPNKVTPQPPLELTATPTGIVTK